VIASAPSPTPQQPPAQSPPQKQSAESQTPHQTNAPPPPQQSQPARPFFRWELGGGYAHISGNEGLNRFNVGGSAYLVPNVSLGFNYDGVYDTTILGSFALTNVGLTTTKSHLQDYMAGRFYFPGVLKIHCGTKNVLPILHPFVQAQFGESELWTEVSSVNVGAVTASDRAFAWLLGGGGDIRFADHWSALVSADLLRTHFADSGQNRIRVILGVVGRF